MSHWTWEYVPDAASVMGGLTPAQIDQVESLAARIADAAAVRRIGTPFDVIEAVSNVKSYGEGRRTAGDHCGAEPADAEPATEQPGCDLPVRAVTEN